MIKQRISVKNYRAHSVRTHKAERAATPRVHLRLQSLKWIQWTNKCERNLQFFWLWVPVVAFSWIKYPWMPFQPKLSSIGASFLPQACFFCSDGMVYRKISKGRKSKYLLTLGQKESCLLCGADCTSHCIPPPKNLLRIMTWKLHHPSTMLGSSWHHLTCYSHSKSFLIKGILSSWQIMCKRNLYPQCLTFPSGGVSHVKKNPEVCLKNQMLDTSKQTELESLISNFIYLGKETWNFERLLRSFR